MVNPRGNRRNQGHANYNAPANQQPQQNNQPPANNDPPANNEPSVPLIRTKEYSTVCRLPERDHLTDDNWFDWKEHMDQVFTNCVITEYIGGTLEKPAADH